MAKGGKKAVKMSGSWKESIRQLKPTRYNRTLNKHIRKANKVIGYWAERKMKGVIKTGSFAANANLTTLLKGHSNPLIHSGEMMNAVTHRLFDRRSVFVGILRSDSTFRYARVVHGLGSESKRWRIKVSPAMRGMFALLAKVSAGQMPASQLQGRAAELYAQHQGPWFPLKKSTTEIKIRPRPFVKRMLQDRTFRRLVKAIYIRAVEDAHRELTKRVNRKGQRA